MAIKDSKDGISWNEWEDALKNREETALEKAREELAEEIDFYKFQQYELLISRLKEFILMGYRGHGKM